MLVHEAVCCPLAFAMNFGTTVIVFPYYAVRGLFEILLHSRANHQ